MFHDIDYATNCCTGCGKLRVTGDWPGCPHEKSGYTNIRDEYPGGMWIENLGPHPIKVYSEGERLRIAKERGLTPFVRHVPVPGTDKSPHTTDWSRGTDAQTLENARILVSRQGESKGKDASQAWVDGTYTNRFKTVLTKAEAIELQVKYGR